MALGSNMIRLSPMMFVYVSINFFIFFFCGSVPE